MKGIQGQGIMKRYGFTLPSSSPEADRMCGVHADFR